MKTSIARDADRSICRSRRARLRVLALAGVILTGTTASTVYQAAGQENGSREAGIHAPPVAAPPEESLTDQEAAVRTGAVAVEGGVAAVTGGTWVAQGPGPTINAQVEMIPGNNPVSGAVHAVATHPTDPDTLYIGAVNGGIWRTTNATAANPNWTPLTDQFPSLAIGAIEFDPTDATNQTLVAGNGQFSNFTGNVAIGTGGIPLAGVLRTTDGGNTWTLLGQATFAGQTISAVGPRGNTILVAVSRGTATGVYRSTDGGATFPFISGTNGLNLGPCFHLAADPGNNNRFYAAIGGFNGGIFRTDDGGANWVNVTDAAIGALVGGATNNIEIGVSAAAGNPLFAGIVNGGRLAGVFRSADMGGTWTAMDLPQTLDDGAAITNATNTTPIVITSAANLPGALFNGSRVRITGVTGNTAANGDFTITLVAVNQFSLNGSAGNGAFAGGGNWQAIQGIHNGGQGGNNFSIAGDPGNGNIVYVGGDRQDYFPNAVGAGNFTGRLFRGDASVAPGGPGTIPSPQWTALTHNGTASNSSPHADSRGMAFDANGNLVEGDDGGVYRRVNPTSNAGDWVSVINDLQVTEFHDIAYDTNSNIILGGTQDTGTPQQTATGSFTWDSVTQADGGDVAVDVVTLAPLAQSIRYTSTQNLGGFAREVYGAANIQVGARVGLIPAGGLAGFVGQFVAPIAVNAVVPAGGLPAAQSVRLVIGGGTATGVPVGAVYEANNAGVAANAAAVNWVQVPTGAGFVLVNRTAIAYGGMSGGAPNPDVLYIGSQNQIFLRTAAGGTLTATSALPAGAGTIVDIVLDPAEWRTAYAIDSNQVFQSRDAGATWQDITGNLGAGGEGNFRAIEYVANGAHDKLLVGTDSGVFAAVVPSFGCWFKLGQDLPNATVWDLDYDPLDDRLVAGTFGRGAWTLANVADLGIPILSVPGPVAFGDVCVGDTGVAKFNVCNTGFENLEIFSITSSDPQFAVTTPTSGFPVVISPDFCFPFQATFSPTSTGPHSTVFTIESNSPCDEEVEVDATGTGAEPEIRVTGSTQFGQVCAENLDLAEKTVTVCNIGKCPLNVDSAAVVDCPDDDFTLVKNPFPAQLNPTACLNVVVAFTPSSCSDDPKVCTLRIESDDPNTPVVTKELTGRTPCASIDVPGDLAFLPTVIQSVDVCETLLPFPVSNTGNCNLHITAFEITDNPLEFDVFALPSFPIILQPGHIAGEGDLAVVFAPEVIDRNRLGEVSVTWVDDPTTGAELTAGRDLCGEGVLTGARVLVTHQGVPLDEVKQVKLLRINANRRNNILRTVDVGKNLPLQTITPAAPCPEIMFHREYGTAGQMPNPFQLLPGSYEVSVMARIDGKMRRKNVGFRVGSCGFNPNIVVNFE